MRNPPSRLPETLIAPNTIRNTGGFSVPLPNRVWVEGSEYEHSGIADLEIYDERFNPHGDDDSQFDYCISIKPK